MIKRKTLPIILIGLSALAIPLKEKAIDRSLSNFYNQKTIDFYNQEDKKIALNYVNERIKLKIREIHNNIINAESSYNKDAVNIPKNLYFLETKADSLNVGARGLCQLTKVAWEQAEKKVPYEIGWNNPRKNIEVSLKYLDQLIDYNSKFNPNWMDFSDNERIEYILACYSCGPTKVNKIFDWDLEKISKKMENYLNKILGEKRT